jgi:hypothetical protein
LYDKYTSEWGEKKGVNRGKREIEIREEGKKRLVNRGNEK